MNKKQVGAFLKIIAKDNIVLPKLFEEINKILDNGKQASK